MFALRPLPPKPSLEFERKQAKALLRRLRAGDPDTIARARERHPAIDASQPAHIRLADAQLVIAREYGFTRWPRLVRYFGDVDRQHYSHGSIEFDGRDHDASVRPLLAQHRGRRAWAGRALAAYVPRFYGMSLDDVYAATVTEDDARLAVARNYGCPSWDVLLERTAAAIRQRPDEWEMDPLKYAGKATEAADLDELRGVVEAHPELLTPSEDDLAMGRNLLEIALHHERRKGTAVMRPIVQWLQAQGFDLQHELNRQLCGHMGMKPETVGWLLDRGADPNWIAPYGIPVLEYALIRYWSG